MGYRYIFAAVEDTITMAWFISVEPNPNAASSFKGAKWQRRFEMGSTVPFPWDNARRVVRAYFFNGFASGIQHRYIHMSIADAQPVVSPDPA
jgi:hypothetical protein